MSWVFLSQHKSEKIKSVTRETLAPSEAVCAAKAALKAQTFAKTPNIKDYSRLLLGWWMIHAVHDHDKDLQSHAEPFFILFSWNNELPLGPFLFRNHYNIKYEPISSSVIDVLSLQLVRLPIICDRNGKWSWHQLTLQAQQAWQISHTDTDQAELVEWPPLLVCIRCSVDSNHTRCIATRTKGAQ